ncbi:ATP-binding protein [Desulforamulus aquiferis]|uniref:ATP-binding protein n=1 Tax=Desulforamulus aquiferis TaxID=1397668 RepID=A0AAW7ZG88_9FIRM|nr:ATP-binding protein [Desulforamulus aquiferis]MDO7788809.1 ATP-binding protein [Desulforamulus aquiferis]
MPVQFQRAQRKRAKLRLALAGPAGAGKTYSALLISFGIGGKVAMIDTERGSGELYSHLGEYDVCTLEAPFLPEKYVEAIKAAEGAGYDIIIIDSLSHAWAGTGGVLDIHGYAADKSGNSWTAWRQVTPRHNELVDALLQSKCHIITTLRTKMDHIQTTENGKTLVKKVGMNPIQRDGMEYEMTVFIDMDQSHMASATKDRTTLFDGQVFKPSKETGKKLVEWLDSGISNSAAVIDFPPTGPLPAPDPNSPAWEALYGERKKEAPQGTTQRGNVNQQIQQQKPLTSQKNQAAKSPVNPNQNSDDPFWNSINQMTPPATAAGSGRRRLF